MTTELDELDAIRERIGTFLREAIAMNSDETLKLLESGAAEVGKSWSGSWFGYHACVYYADLLSPPPGAHFSSEWGLMERQFAEDTRGDWREYSFDDVRAEIIRRAGGPDLTAIRDWAERGKRLVRDTKSDVLSILQHTLDAQPDSFLDRLREEVEKVKVFSNRNIIDHLRPSGTLMSRDAVAMSQGLRTPPHVSIVAETGELRSPANACESLERIVRQISAHMNRKQRSRQRQSRLGTNVFIGHGRSPVWKDLKDFMQDRMRLPWDEFNRVPVAGITNIARLSEMLDAAAVAFLVLTAEDEQTNGKLQARANVIHEAGLFQGRLGFTRAIVLLEDGCEEFSNIQGLGQIRFPTGNIKAAFEEIRQVLEREGVVDGNV